MTGEFRDCPSCCQGELTQHHQHPERCPDSADGRCPEWFCESCGATLLLDLPLAAAGALPGPPAARQLDRVA